MCLSMLKSRPLKRFLVEILFNFPKRGIKIIDVHEKRRIELDTARLNTSAIGLGSGLSGLYQNKTDSSMMLNKDKVRRLALKLGADLVGFGPAEAMDEAPAGHRARDFLPDARTVISAAARINYSAVDGLPLTRREYVNANDSSRALLNGVICGIARYLEEEGYSAIPFLQGSDRKMLMGDLSLKHAAVVAGLGEFGLNNLLLTPRFGPRVLLGAVVTDAPIIPDPPLKVQLCDLCGACLKACPVGAIKEPKGYDRRKGWSIDKHRCSHYIHEVLEPDYGHYSCGLCIKACHVGKEERLQREIQARLK